MLTRRRTQIFLGLTVAGMAACSEAPGGGPAREESSGGEGSGGTVAAGHEPTSHVLCVTVTDCPGEPKDQLCPATCWFVPECDCPGERCYYVGDVDGDGVLVELSLQEFWEYPYSTAVACERPHPQDCDDSDPLRFEQGGLDRDGDGYVSTAVCSFPGEPDVHFGPSLVSDCDDTDPQRQGYGHLDYDGDGFTSEIICAGPDDPVLSWQVGPDCDDTDPTKSSVHYPDEDGDGWGDANRGLCGPYEEGWVGFAGDCDDADPGRPSPLEIWGDDYDSDCDGDDGTLSFPEECRRDYESLPETCVGVNLILSENCSPENCASARLLQVTNNGTESYQGTIQVSSDAQVIWETEVTLGPGEATPLFTAHGVGDADSLFLVSPDADDCNGSYRVLGWVACNIP